MKKRLLIFLSLCIIAGYVGTVAAKEVPYTLEDRDRLIRVEEGLKAVNQRIDGLDKRIDALDKRIDALDKRIDSLDKRIDGLQGLMYVVIGAVIAQTIGIVGFVLWDRRSALAPAIRKNKELEEREDTIEKVLKEYAKQEPRLAEILKSAKLL
jgi:chaperonin cofactor prefoldin